MAESQKKVSSSVSSKEEDSLPADLDIGNDLFSSWKPMSLADGDGMDFDLKPGNKKSFNFDKAEVRNTDGLDKGKKINDSSTTQNKDKEKSKYVLRQRETMKDLDTLSSCASFALEVNKIAAQSSGNPTTLATIATSKNVPWMQRNVSGMALKISREVPNADLLHNGKRAPTQNEDKAKSESVPEQRETSTKALDTLRDIDFNLDAVGKMSSFNMDMSELDISLPLKKDGQPKENWISFTFDFDELDNDSSLPKEGSDDHKDKSKKQSPPVRSECLDDEGSQHMKQMGSMATPEDAPHMPYRPGTVMTFDTDSLVGGGENLEPVKENRPSVAIQEVASDDENWSPDETDQAISCTAIVSYIKDGKAFIVADGQLTTINGEFYSDSTQKIKIVEGKYAVALSGSVQFAKKFAQEMKQSARRDNTFSDICDTMEKFCISWSERHVAANSRSGGAVVIGFNTETERVAIDKMVSFPPERRVIYMKEGDMCGEGSASAIELVTQQFNALNAANFFKKASKEVVLRGLRSCILLACLKLDSCGGLISEAVVDKKRAELFVKEDVITLLPDYYDMISSANEDFKDVGLFLSTNETGTCLKDFKDQCKALSKTADMIPIATKIDLGVVVWVVYPKEGSRLGIRPTNRYLRDFPENMLVPICRSNLKALARYFEDKE